MTPEDPAKREDETDSNGETLSEARPAPEDAEPPREDYERQCAAAIDKELNEPAILQAIEDGRLSVDEVRQRAFGLLRDLPRGAGRSDLAAALILRLDDEQSSLAGRLADLLDKIIALRSVRVIFVLSTVAMAVLAIAGLVDARGVLALGAVVLALVGFFVAQWQGEALQREEAKEKQRRQRLEETAARALRRLQLNAERLTRNVINELSQKSFVLALKPTDTTGLRAMSDREFDVDTASSRHLAEILETIRAGAIGIAGRRGAGKTTMIRAACTDRLPGLHHESVGVFIAAPVRYDAREFIVLLLANICRKVLGVEGQTADWRNQRTRRRQIAVQQSAVIFGAFASLGVAASVARPELGLPLKIGIAVLLSLFAVAAIAPWIAANSGDRRRRLSTPGDDVFGRARRTLDWLTFIESQTQEVAAEVGVGKLKASGKTARSRTGQLASLPEVLHEFQSVVPRLAEVRPLVVGIDELDKMASAEDAERFLNDIKGVLNVEGVCYLVSLSDDAMTAFGRRGLPLRDAFESAFDELVPARALLHHETQQLLQQRVVPMSPPFATLCHSLSGGLARETIRVARLSVRLAGRLREPTMKKVAAGVVVATVRSREAAARSVASRHIASDGSQPMLDWMSDLAEPATPQMLLGRTDISVVLEAIRAAPLEDEARLVLGLLAMELSASWYHLATVWTAFADLNEQRYEQLMKPRPEPNVFDVLARAERSLGVAPKTSWTCTSSARRRLDLPVMEYPGLNVVG